MESRLSQVDKDTAMMPCLMASLLASSAPNSPTSLSGWTTTDYSHDGRYIKHVKEMPI